MLKTSSVSWYPRFVPNFALSNLQQATFDKLKLVLVNAPVLQRNDPSKLYVLRTDADNCALGSILLHSEISETPQRIHQ